MGEDKNTRIRLLLVDDEEDFRRATSKALVRRGFQVSEADSGEMALVQINRIHPEIIILDLKMPGMSGIETLQEIRKLEVNIPVIILTGHGSFHDALTGINLKIVDFLQKPVDMDLLEVRIRKFLAEGKREILRERTIAELMVSPSIYPKLYIDQPVAEAVEKLQKAFLPEGSDEIKPPQIRSALVFDRDEKFLGLIRFPDLLKLVMPSYLAESPYISFFTGMFLAQCKMIGQRAMEDLIGENITVEINAPLMEAIYLMVRNHIVTLPVLKQGDLVGVLREKDIILEIAKNLGTLKLSE